MKYIIIVTKDSATLKDIRTYLLKGGDIKSLVKPSDRYLIDCEFNYRLCHLGNHHNKFRGIGFDVVFFMMKESDVPVEIIDLIYPTVKARANCHLIYN